MLSVTSRRLEALRTHSHAESKDAYEVVKWLEERGGKTRFKHQVFGPPILSLGVKDKRLASVAEACFRITDLLVRSYLFHLT